MARRRKHARVLIYSHDTFGLGHLRRCRAIAHALVGTYEHLSVLILSGSPIIGSFDFRSRVDFVRIPGIIKLRNGQYTPLKLHIDTDDTLALRESIIEHTAMAFDPDLFIVDKEPLGLRGEVRTTLEMLKDRSIPTVLGLRDVMDEPALLGPEWKRKQAMPALERFYDEIWVYGREEIWNPLTGLDVPGSVRDKIVYTGYLPRMMATNTLSPSAGAFANTGGPFVLVTTGGGGDGEALIDWTLAAYEADPDIEYPAVMVLGPFMDPERQTEFHSRAASLDKVEMLTFDAHMEALIDRAVGVVAMGGYNTFCEILSYDKPAIIVPREKPRKEQLIRATQAERMGLVRCLPEADENPDPRAMAAAIRALPVQPRPSERMPEGFLDGLDRVNARAGLLLERGVPTADVERLVVGGS